jgi:hypothetical protein
LRLETQECLEERLEGGGRQRRQAQLGVTENEIAAAVGFLCQGGDAQTLWRDDGLLEAVLPHALNESSQQGWRIARGCVGPDSTIVRKIRLRGQETGKAVEIRKRLCAARAEHQVPSHTHGLELRQCHEKPQSWELTRCECVGNDPEVKP